MSTTWSTVPLGGTLSRARETITLHPESRYSEITVKLWGRGVVQRRVASGAEIGGGRRFVARASQLIMSRIDARNGAIGIVPEDLDGSVVTNDFPVFDVNRAKLDPAFLGWLSRTAQFAQLCRRASEGTTNRVRLKEERFLAVEIPLPPLADQRRLAARIEELAAKLAQLRAVRDELRTAQRHMLASVFQGVTDAAPSKPMREVAPLVRRPIQIDPESEYPELGIRSFGRGTFHKEALPGVSVGSKKLFELRPGDLVFNNVFAWEGAVAVAKEADAGRFGSHRFITCVPLAGVVTSQFLWFHFLTESGLDQLREASPGGAGRNRTLGLDALANIQVPVPAFERQVWFDELQRGVDAVKGLQAEADHDLDALLPSILDKAFSGQL